MARDITNSELREGSLIALDVLRTPLMQPHAGWKSAQGTSWSPSAASEAPSGPGPTQIHS